MTNFDQNASTTHNDPVNRVAVAPRAPMTTTGPLFSSEDIAASIVAAVMILGPLAMAAFAVGRH
jgi:hypothetical protein